MKHHNSHSIGIKKTESFMYLFTTNIRLKFVVGVLIMACGLICATAATDFCQQTSRLALEGCQSNAKSDQSIALGKCDNVSDPTARTACRDQAVTDFQN